MLHASLHHDVLEKLGSSIVSGVRRPGEVLTGSSIETEYGVSRSVAREVVRVLENLRMVRSTPRVGITILDPSEWNLLDPLIIHWRLDGPGRLQQLRALNEMREGVEPAAARLAARRATWAQMHTLTETAAAMLELGKQGLGNSEEFLEADVIFHTTLLLASGNEMYAGLQDFLTACLRGRNASGLTPAHPAMENMQSHCDLAAAIESRDENEAEKCAQSIVHVVGAEIG